MSNAKEVAKALREEREARGFALLLFPYLFMYFSFPPLLIEEILNYFGFEVSGSTFALMCVVSGIVITPIMFIYSKFFAVLTKLIALCVTISMAYGFAKLVYIETNDYSWSILTSIVICLVSAILHSLAFTDLSYDR
ncbi:hypothetical protein [Oligella urethralis]|uniref:Uncharacterized protein n=1 Tax=Oligella urethralis TaxID=90245 RepID=A0A2X1UMP1_9BURK|nr:hypothetical protein [Oligella urethralis]SPY08442.1 Uncharacterised protein [Oligella urethralis]